MTSSHWTSSRAWVENTVTRWAGKLGGDYESAFAEPLQRNSYVMHAIWPLGHKSSWGVARLLWKFQFENSWQQNECKMIT